MVKRDRMYKANGNTGNIYSLKSICEGEYIKENTVSFPKGMPRHREKNNVINV